MKLIIISLLLKFVVFNLKLSGGKDNTKISLLSLGGKALAKEGINFHISLIRTRAVANSRRLERGLKDYQFDISWAA